MANAEHLSRLTTSVSDWNEWRRANLEVWPDLSGADLSGAELVDAYLSRTNFVGATLVRANLSGANLSKATLDGVNLSNSNLSRAVLSAASLVGSDLTDAHLRDAQLNGTTLERATLTDADVRDAFLISANLSGGRVERARLRGANLTFARLIGTDLTGADLRETRLHKADLSDAVLSGCDLERASLVDSRLVGARLVGCTVFGISAWNVDLTGARQDDLVVTPSGEATITVDDLEVAQFVYLLLNNQKIRSVIDTVTARAVLILGRFTPERKVILDSLRDELRRHDLLPILFDFDQPTSRTILETVGTLARLARFIVADITDPKSIPQELAEVVQSLPSVPVQPLIEEGSDPWAMFESVAIYPWVLDLVRYRDAADLLVDLPTKIIRPAQQKADELQQRLQTVRESVAPR